MTGQHRPAVLEPRGWSRRDVLKAAGVAGLGLAAVSSLEACGVGGGERHPNGAAAITGSFDWKAAKGSTVRLLQTPHPYQQSFQPLLKEFQDLTGITVVADLVPEGAYFTKLNTELAGGSGSHDVFMTGAYFIWQYGPPGWMEDLKPWIQNAAATSQEYDFEDIYQGLRTSTSWDFKFGSPLGTGGQWAIPWGFENNVVAYNKSYFDSRASSLPTPGATSSSSPSTSPTAARVATAWPSAGPSHGRRSTPASSLSTAGWAARTTPSRAAS